MGHTHYPFIFSYNNCIIANPGSVGQPRDISGLASFIILDTSNHAIVFRRVPFETNNLIKLVAKKDPNLPYNWKVLSKNWFKIKKMNV